MSKQFDVQELFGFFFALVSYDVRYVQYSVLGQNVMFSLVGW